MKTIWFGLTLLFLQWAIPEGMASLDQELQQKRQALTNIEGQANRVKADLKQEFPNEKRTATEIVNSDIANLQTIINKLKDARLAVLTVQVAPKFLDPDSTKELYRQLNKKLSPYFKVDQNGSFEWGPAFQNSYLRYIPLPSLDGLKTFLDDLIKKHENNLNKRKAQLRILQDEEDLKNDIQYLEKQIAQNKQQGQWKVTGLRIICPRVEIFEDENLICKAEAALEGESRPKDVSTHPDTTWTPGTVRGGIIRGGDLGVGNHSVEAGFRGHSRVVSIRVLQRPMTGPPRPVVPTPPGPGGPPGPPGPTASPSAGCLVPDVVGYSEEAARYDITQAGCQVGMVTYISSDASAGEVAGQNPAPGTALPTGGTVNLVVSQNEPRRIFVDPPRTTIDLDESVTFTATLIYKDGKQELLPDSAVRWQPGNPFSGTNPGTFTITATARGLSGSATVTVNEASGSTAWERPMTSADQRGLRLPAPPPDAFTWYALCERRTGEIVYGEHPDPTRFDILGGPFPGPRTVKAWIDEKHPSWRCPGAVPAPHQWHVLCDKKTFDVVLGKDTDPTRYRIISGPFVGEPEARTWANSNAPSWRCPDEAPPDALTWHVLCDRKTHDIVLGKYPDPTRYDRMAGPFAGEPEARAWTDANQPSWRCPGGPVGAGEGWYALCDKRSYDVVLGKNTDPTKYDVLGGPFHGEPEARTWANANVPSWRCPSGPAADGWYVLCDDRMGGIVVLGKNTAGYRVMGGPFHGEPEARAWTDKTCPSWRCGEPGACGEAVDLYVLCVKTRGQVVITQNFNPHLHSQMAGPFKGQPAARNWLKNNCPSELCDANGSCFSVSLDKITGRLTEREERRTDEVSRRSQDAFISGLSGGGGSKTQEEIAAKVEETLEGMESSSKERKKRKDPQQPSGGVPPTTGESNYYIIREASLFLERTAECTSTEYRVEGPVTEEQSNQIVSDLQKAANKKIGGQTYPFYVSITVAKVSKHPVKPTAPKGGKNCKSCPPGQHIGLDPGKRFCHAD